MMRRFAILAAVAVIFCGCSARASDNGVVLPPDQAKEIVNQCSRMSPEHITGVWTPSADQIAAFEAALMPKLAEELKRSGRDRSMASHYFFQYAGLIAGGRKFIYVNSFRGDVGDFPNWKTQPVMVCDGGDAFFGAEYDPQTKTFANFAFNGFA